MNHNDVRLEHAFLSVKSLERSLGFYQQLFPGWVVRWSGEAGDGRWVHFGAPGAGQPSYLSLWENARLLEGAEGGIQHIGFTHPNVAGLAQRLSEAGIEPSDGPMDDGLYLRCYYLDPDGHQLEFVEMHTSTVAGSSK